MSELSKERLEEIESVLSAGALGYSIEREEVLAMARELLALRKERERAEPVAWTDEQELRDVAERGCGYLFTVNPITPHADPRRVIKLYAEPPAPVVVPECFERLLRHAYGMSMGTDWNKGTAACHHREALCRAVDDCRAAMLAAPGKEG
ncbi:hypothetical protein AAAW50_003040 [Cronobacter sakazakii]